MNPLEQLKILHSEALTRLSQHPDFQLIKQLEPIIDALENPEVETSENLEDAQDSVAAENEVTAGSDMEASPSEEEAEQIGNEAAALAAAAVSAELLEIEDEIDETGTDIEEDMTDVPAPSYSFDDVTAVKAELEEVMSADTEQAVEEVSEETDETDPLVALQNELDAEPLSEAPAVTLDTVDEAIAETAAEEPNIELDASNFETEEAFIGSIDQELTDALANTDFAAEVAGSSESAENATIEIEEATEQEHVQTEASTELDVDIDIEKELSIEALIDEQVAKLLSEDRPI